MFSIKITEIVLALEPQFYQLNRRSYMSAHVLLNLGNELRTRDKMLGSP